MPLYIRTVPDCPPVPLFRHGSVNSTYSGDHLLQPSQLVGLSARWCTTTNTAFALLQSRFLALSNTTLSRHCVESLADDRKAWAFERPIFIRNRQHADDDAEWHSSSRRSSPIACHSLLTKAMTIRCSVRPTHLNVCELITLHSKDTRQ